jgi:hypothetical protein
MTAAQTQAILGLQAALYGHNSSQRIAELIKAVDVLAASLQTLRTHPTHLNADRVLHQTFGIHRAASQLNISLSWKVYE